MQQRHRGFTLIELIAVMILVGILSITLMSRIDSANTAGVQAGRDSLIAALFFAQQTAMARDSVIRLTASGNTISVTENGNPLMGYPLALSGGVSISGAVFTYDKLGRTTKNNVTISHTSGSSATVTVEASGYAHY